MRYMAAILYAVSFILMLFQPDATSLAGDPLTGYIVNVRPTGQCVVIDEDIKTLLISLLKAYNEKQQEVLSAKIAGTARLTRCDGSGACNVYSKESYPNMEDWQRWGNNFAVNIPSICPKAFKKYSEDGIQKASTVADFDFSYQESAKAFSAHVQASMIFRKDNGNWLLSDWTNALK